MTKAILVLNEMPKCCDECDFKVQEDEEKCTAKGWESINNIICPLKEMPKKINELSFEETLVGWKVGDTNIIKGINFEKAIIKGKQRGWNECINKILGNDND